MITLNLIPESILAAQARRRRAKYWGVAVAVGIVGVLIPLFVDALHRAELAAMITENDAVQKDRDQVREELRSLTAEVAKIDLQLERAQALRAKRAWSGLLAFVGTCMPRDCWLTTVATEPSTPPLSAVRPNVPPSPGQSKSAGVMTLEAPRKLRLIGYAEEAASPYAFVRTLKETMMFEKVALTRSMRDPAVQSLYFRFEIECEW